MWGEALARGRRERAADRAPLQISAGGPFAITTDPGPLRELGRAKLALYIGGTGSERTNFYNQVVRRYGYAREAEDIQRLYLSGRKAAAEAAVPMELLAGTSLIGDERYLRDRLQTYATAGVTTLQVDPVGDNPMADLRRLRELIEAI